MTTALTLSTLLSETGSSLGLASIAAEGGVNLDFDLTFVVQMVAFAILVAILKPVLFDPMMKLFDERERRTDGAKLLARRMDEKAGEILKKYEAEVERVRRVATEERERLRGEGQRLEATIVAQAREETAKIMDEGKARLEKEAAKIRSELRAKVPEVSRDVAAAVLGREVGS